MTTLERDQARLDAPRRSAGASMTPWLIASVGLLAVAIILSLCLGARSIPLGTVWDVHDFSIADRPILFQRLQLPPGHRPLEIGENLPSAVRGPSSRRVA